MQWNKCVYYAESQNERRLLCKSVFIPIERQTLIPRKVERAVFLMKPNHQYHLSQRGECVYGAQSWNEMILLCESVFIKIERWNSILKMVEIEVFPMKPKHQYHLSKWGDCVYGAQSCKERRLLCETRFIVIERWTSILKMIEREVFLMKPKHQYH